jgi:hypothetical protein
MGNILVAKVDPVRYIPDFLKKAGIYMKNFLSGAILTVGFINVVLFFVWVSLVKVEATEKDLGSYVYNNITLQFTILEIILSVIAFGTAIVAIFGYKAIKDGAESTAIRTAQEYLEKNGQQLIRNEVSKVIVLTGQPTYSLDRAEKDAQNREEERNGI